MWKAAYFGTAFATATFLVVIVADGAFARGGGGGHGSGSHSTSGYYRGNGTYVQGYHATNPNSTKLDNYSTKGNVNPWTGKPGTKSPYGVSTAHYHHGRYYGSRPVAQGFSGWTSASAPGAVPFTASYGGSGFPVTVYNPYHPHWTVDVVH
jgi:hypothetical protein